MKVEIKCSKCGKFIEVEIENCQDEFEDDICFENCPYCNTSNIFYPCDYELS